jgi:hypothetical protein
VTGHEDEPDWIIALRRRPASSSDTHPDGGTSTFEIICRMCGDDSALDHRQAPAELRRIRGSYTLLAGIAAFLGGGRPSTSHDADDERFACLDDFLGDDREMVDVQDASVIRQLDDALAHVRA